jgi:hypothetical protein
VSVEWWEILERLEEKQGTAPRDVIRLALGEYLRKEKLI